MKNTKNYNLQKPDFNNVADIDVLNSNFDITDKSLSVPYRATLKSGTTDTFIVTTGINKTELSDLFKITVVFPSATTTETKLVIDSCAPVKIVKAGNSNKKVKAKEVCNLVYSDSDSVFMCASGSCDDVSFTSDKLLEDSSANNSDGEKVTGTMPNIGQQTATINAAGKVTISKGYHDGTGYIQSNSMSTQLTNLGVTLTSASQLVKDVKAVDKNGNLITGTATIQSLGGFEIKTGALTINNTDLTNNTYSIQLSQLNLPRTPKFVTCNWTLTHSHRYDGKKYEETVSSYTYFDWINGKCSYPTYTVWSHDQSGTDKIVDSIRDFTDKTTLYMHVQRNGRYLIPTSSGYTDFSRSEMTVNWTAIV